MQQNLKIYVFKVDGKLVEFKAMSKYEAKVRAKKLGGAGVDVEFVGVKGVEE